jgi:hypothetical protein
VSTKGSPYARFRRALETGKLALIPRAADGVPQVPLDDALRIFLLLRDKPLARYDQARKCLGNPWDPTEGYA